MNYLVKGALVFSVLGSGVAHANIQTNIATCDEFVHAYENGQDISLTNDIECSGQKISISSNSSIPSYIEGNEFTVYDVHFESRNGGFINPTGVIKDISFERIHLTRTNLNGNYNYVLGDSLGSKGFINNLEVSDITSEEAFTSLLGAVHSEIDGLRVYLWGNTIEPSTAVFSRGNVSSATLANMRVIGGEVRYPKTSSGVALLGNTVNDSTIVNVLFRNQKINSDGEFWFVGSNVYDNYINGYTLKNYRFTNPQATKHFISRNEKKDSNNMVVNYRHNFWPADVEPLWENFDSPYSGSTSVYEVIADGEVFNIPQECTFYLKQEKYFLQYKDAE
ncbi:hypothetical protein [Vibrio agarivorans]|uniref:Uncharacterized protein n=1 Tax=Vibrio agarivorans TaxID=153622 RepID=A0ABT7Y6Z5_9VIBR|nr:hypothetical protein [Vibrio agarivorans]MDN2483822.1 hypothetical protein [Vibrio agarivorans]